MEKEQVAVDEAVETVAEQNTRAYSKTVWNESTPITADKLNKMETGIANGIDKSAQIMEIPITNAEGWQQFRWTKPNYNAVSWTRDASGKKALEIFNETTKKQLLLLNDDGILTTSGNLNSKGNLAFSNHGNGGKLNANIHNLALHNATGNGQMMTVGNDNRIYVGNPQTPLVFESNTTPEMVIGVSRYQLFHTGNFNPATKLDAGQFSVHNRDLQIYGKRALVGFNTPDGNYLSINHDRDFANGVAIHGLLRADNIEAGGKLAFSTAGAGGGLNANIHNLTLHTNTGNGQMLTADTHKIYVGNPQTPLAIESSSNPEVKVGNALYQLYHTGNKPTPWDIGAMSSNAPSFQGNMIQAGAGGRDWIYHINADMGSLHMAPHNNGNNDWDRQIMFDRDGQIFCNGRKKVPTWDGNPTHYMFRYGSGLGGANGYITFSY